MPEINEPQKPPQASSIMMFAYPFRTFFLSVAAWAIVIVPLWLLIVTGALQLPLAVPPLHWHRHEIVFGFLNPAIAGFLLTAVCVWTNTQRLHGSKLFLLWLVWLAGRLVMLFGEALPFAVVEIVNLAFLPLVMLDASWRIRRARQYKQLVILLILGLLWGMQMALLGSGDLRFLHAALVIAILLMLVIGGRITPSFSINWLKRNGYSEPPVKTLPLLERAIILSTFLLFAAILYAHSLAIIVLALFVAACSLLRLILWRSWLVRSEPLLWILHVSLLWIPVGLILLVCAELQWIGHNPWQHVIGIGAMAGLTLGVMTRVSLGHTGRELKLPAGIVSAYFLIQAAVILRIVTALDLLPWQTGLTLSAIAWVLAFAIFLWRYLPVLLGSRVDGRPG
jgi:uncharacterized protein involved in response to NO